MPRIVAVHSFRRGTGKSTLVANLAALLALEGRRIGLVDAGLDAPSLAWLLGADLNGGGPTLNDYLAGRCPLAQAARPLAVSAEAELSLIPAASSGAFDSRAHVNYDVEKLDADLRAWAREARLEVILIDARSGVNEESMLALTVADLALVLLRLDKQDYQGTAVVVDLLRNLQVPQTALVVNSAPANFDPRQVLREVEKTYNCPVAAILPFAEEMLAMGGEGLFVRAHPLHPLARLLQGLAGKVAA